jgi:glycosyltransferase involved in cell wall biosynthesis
MLLFLPTSPAHVAALGRIRAHLPGWRVCSLLRSPETHWTNGIRERCLAEGIDVLPFPDIDALDQLGGITPTMVGFGAVFENRAVELFAWAKSRSLPTFAIEEVVQIALNNGELNNYDLPFDRLFVANRAEADLFVAARHDPTAIRVSGPPVDDGPGPDRDAARARLGLDPFARVVVYTTTPIRWRLSVHGKDDRAFRRSIFDALARLVVRRDDIVVLIKLHPSENADVERGEAAALIPRVMVRGAEASIHDVLAAADVLVNRGNSQTALQAVHLGVPVVVAACGLRTVFHRYGGAFVVDRVGQLAEAVVQALDGGRLPTDALIAAIWHSPSGGAAGYIAREIEALATADCSATPATWDWTLKTALFHAPHMAAEAVRRMGGDCSALVRTVASALDAEHRGERREALEAWLACERYAPTWFYPHEAAATIASTLGDRALLHAQMELALGKLPSASRANHEIPLRLTAVRFDRARDAFDCAAASLRPLLVQGLQQVMPEVALEQACLRLAVGDWDGGRDALDMAEAAIRDHPIDDLDRPLRPIADDVHAVLEALPAVSSEPVPPHLISTIGVRPKATIVIAARNAAATIGRAIRSAAAQPDCAIVLVDDFSEDDTVAIARSEAPHVTVVQPPCHGLLGLTRQVGLDAVTTPFGVWCDADDEVLPGRVERLLRAMTAERADLAFDSVDLVDGASGEFQRTWSIPRFLGRPPYLFRLFERNYLPSLGQVAFRTAFARQIGYDPALHGTEDTDFTLRALAAGGRAALVHEIGYRMYTYPSSVSRQLERQREMYKRALVKHDYADVSRMALDAGALPPTVAWILVSLAIFRDEYSTALRLLDEADSLLTHPDDCADPGGPCPLPDGWRLAFHRGTLELLLGNAAGAIASLREAERRRQTPEGANNLGVALASFGELEAARDCFARAAAANDAFVDPRINLLAERPVRITTHPLRREPARTDYAGVPANPAPAEPGRITTRPLRRQRGRRVDPVAC